MAEKIKKSKPESLKMAKRIKTEDKIMAARKRLLDMREELVGEGLGKSLPEDLARPFDIGDEGDRADSERTQRVSVLLSVRDKEKLLAIDEALDKILDGTYGECEECGDEIGAGRLKAMPLAKLCISCQSEVEKERAQQRFAEEGSNQHRIIEEAEEEAE
jgi:RNA polymerase-binding transcription factor